MAKPQRPGEYLARFGFMPHVPEDVLAHSRAINGWRLDEQRLAQALDVHAPHVRIVRL